MSPASNSSKQNASKTDHMCMTEQENLVGGHCPVNHRSTTLRSWKHPENAKQKILRRRPRRRGELVQAGKPIGAGCGGEASIRAGGAAIKTLYSWGNSRGGKSVLEIRQCCSLREMVGVLPKNVGRIGRVIPGTEQVKLGTRSLRYTADQRNFQKPLHK